MPKILLFMGAGYMWLDVVDFQPSNSRYEKVAEYIKLCTVLVPRMNPVNFRH